MRKALCFGSLNIDYVYDVPHILRPGETPLRRIDRSPIKRKGLNQSIARKRVATFHAGCRRRGRAAEMLQAVDGYPIRPNN